MANEISRLPNLQSAEERNQKLDKIAEAVNGLASALGGSAGGGGGTATEEKEFINFDGSTTSISFINFVGDVKEGESIGLMLCTPGFFKTKTVRQKASIGGKYGNHLAKRFIEVPSALSVDGIDLIKTLFPSLEWVEFNAAQSEILAGLHGYDIMEDLPGFNIGSDFYLAAYKADIDISDIDHDELLFIIDNKLYSVFYDAGFCVNSIYQYLRRKRAYNIGDDQVTMVTAARASIKFVRNYKKIKAYDDGYDPAYKWEGQLSHRWVEMRMHFLWNDSTLQFIVRLYPHLALK